MKSSQVDTVWILTAACLVFFMQAGFAAREAGLTRSKNAMSAATKILGGTLVVALIFWALGFSLVAGNGDFLGSGPMWVSADEDPAVLAGFIFQLALACVPAAIVSGALAERIRLAPFLMVVALYAASGYPLFTHWAQAGWLGSRGFVDAAGATTVHASGGFLALAGLIAVGPRAGRFDGERRPVSIPGSSQALAILGTFFLWLGFLGEAGGPAPGERLAHVLAGNLVAGAAGGAVALAIGWALRKRPEVELPMLGVLGGLCAVTGAGHAFSTPAALIIGGVAGGVVLGVEALLVRLGLDDATGAVPVHLGGGLWGTLAVGVFGDLRLLGTGLPRGLQLKAQLEGLLTAFIVVFVVGYLIFRAVALVMRLRLSPADETAGLNASEHGAGSELDDLVDVMEEQARTGDLTLRAEVEPFTEVGAIARHYNRVMETVAFTTAQVESLVRTSLDALVTFDTQGIVTSSNPAASAIFGYSEREFRSVAVTSLFAPSRDKTKGRADLGTLLKTFVGQSREVRGQRRSGEEFTMEASFNYVAVGEDEIYTATMRDITQRKETEAELFRAQAEIRRRLEQELEDAKVVQKALLPSESQFPGCEIARHYQAATETGGDWYGYSYSPETQSITFYMGDVTGHGLPSALLSGVVCGAVYSSEYTHGLFSATRLPSDKQLRNLADVVNRIVLQTGKGELMMTMAFIYVNLRTGQLAFLNAGHNMPYLVKNGGAETAAVSNLVARGSRLGESSRPEFDVVHARLEPGDVIVLYTDGLVENQGKDGKVFSVREMKQVLQSKKGVTDIRDELVARAKSVWGDEPAADDHSVLVFRWTPTTAASGPAPGGPGAGTGTAAGTGSRPPTASGSSRSTPAVGSQAAAGPGQAAASPGQAAASPGGSAQGTPPPSTKSS
jgi:ammonium transporter